MCIHKKFTTVVKKLWVLNLWGRAKGMCLL
ncbi:hypothetical protein LINGRAHAP2_LOCUS19918 [Linum grandiflorum]